MLAEAEDGAWCVSIPSGWRPLDGSTHEKRPESHNSVEKGWLIERFSESEKAIFLVWRGAGEDRIEPDVVPTKEAVQEQFGPGKQILEIGVRDIAGRPYWRLVMQVHTETDGRTTKQVMYKSWDEDGTYAFQFIAPPDRFDQRLPMFETVAGSIRIAGPHARSSLIALLVVLGIGVALLAGALLLFTRMARRNRSGRAARDGDVPI